MHKDKPLEAINLTLESEYPDLFEFSYRLYLSKTGWTDWAESGTILGSPNSGEVIQALEVNLK